jgi:hypothetical protein
LRSTIGIGKQLIEAPSASDNGWLGGWLDVEPGMETSTDDFFLLPGKWTQTFQLISTEAQRQWIVCTVLLVKQQQDGCFFIFDQPGVI